jgi:hypothetical protein
MIGRMRRPGGCSRCYPITESILVDDTTNQFYMAFAIGHAGLLEALSVGETLVVGPGLKPLPWRSSLFVTLTFTELDLDAKRMLS